MVHYSQNQGAKCVEQAPPCPSLSLSKIRVYLVRSGQNLICTRPRETKSYLFQSVQMVPFGAQMGTTSRNHQTLLVRNARKKMGVGPIGIRRENPKVKSLSRTTGGGATSAIPCVAPNRP